MQRPRLFWYIYTTYLAVIAVVVVAVGVIGYTVSRQIYFDEAARGLEARAALARDQLAPLLRPGAQPQLQAMTERLARGSATRLTVIAGSLSLAETGTVLAESDAPPQKLANHNDRPEVKSALAGSVGQATRFSSTLDRRELYVAVPVRDGSTVRAVVRAAMPLTTVGEALRPALWEIAIGAVVVIAAAAIIGYFVSSRISAPMRALQASAERFANGDLAHKLTPMGTQEFVVVAQALNMMAERLDSEIRTLTHERNEREAVLVSMVEGVIAVDQDERIITLNRAAAKLLGVDRDPAAGLSIQEAVRNPDFHQIIAETLAGDAPVERDLTIHSDSGRRILQANGSPLIGPDGGASAGALLVLNDVTRLKRLEQVRSDFVANVSHELKTPITSIKGFAETLLEGAAEDPEARGRFLRIIASQADRLSLLIADLLALSALEADEVTSAQLQPTDICEVVRGAIEICAMAAARKSIKLDLICTDVTIAPANPSLVEQAIVNLIDNAIKYSPEASTVEICVAARDDEVSVRVCDEGPGIAREHQQRLFERFYRVDKARSRDLGGTGLGLAIVKHVAQVHNGRASLSSTPGQGSTFEFALPRA